MAPKRYRGKKGNSNQADQRSPSKDGESSFTFQGQESVQETEPSSTTKEEKNTISNGNTVESEPTTAPATDCTDSMVSNCDTTNEVCKGDNTHNVSNSQNATEDANCQTSEATHCSESACKPEENHCGQENPAVEPATADCVATTSPAKSTEIQKPASELKVTPTKCTEIPKPKHENKPLKFIKTSTGTFFVNQHVITPYGNGKIESLRSETMIVVRPDDWLLANHKKPVFFMNPKDVQPFYKVNDEVTCSFGAGVINDIRETDAIYVIRLNNWKLADGKSPVLYLNEHSFKRYEKPKQEEKNQFEETFKGAMLAKNEAKECFKSGDTVASRAGYDRVLQTLNDLLHGSLSNKERAMVVEQNVQCSNSLAVCCFKLKLYGECAMYAKNTLVLVNALETTMPDGQVWQSLQATGFTVERMAKEWKFKGLFYVGKAELLKANFQVALDNLKAALAIVQNDETMEAQQKECQKLIADATKKLTTETKREKAIWSKAFEKSKKSESSMYHDPKDEPASPVSPSPSNLSLSPPSSPMKADETLKQTAKNNAAADKSKSSTELWKPDTVSLFVLAGLGLAGGLWFWWTKFLSKQHKWF